MKCGLVILTHTNVTFTQTLIDRVKTFPEIDHLVIVYNGSPDESYEYLKQNESSKTSVLYSGYDGGYSFGNNFGIRYLIKNFQPDIIGIANPDVIFEDSLVKRIKELFAANPDYAVITGFQLDANGQTGAHPFWEDNSKPSFTLKPMLYSLTFAPFVKLFNKLRHKKPASIEEEYRAYCERIRTSPEALNQVWAVEGSLFFIRTKDFDSIGLFDERVFMYHEENIIALKLHELGRKEGVANDVTYIHDHNSVVTEEKLNWWLASHKFYLRHYVFRNKLLLGVYLILSFLLKLKSGIKTALKKLISLFR